MRPTPAIHRTIPHRFPGETLLSGKFPSVDQFGRPLNEARALKAGTLICGGWRAAFCAWCGDWKERALSHQYAKRNYQSCQLCDLCGAIRPFPKTPPEWLDRIFTNFNRDAFWVRTIRTHEEYLQTTAPAQRTPWLDLPGFLITRVMWDSAHTILLGAGKDIAASFLFDVDTCHCFGCEFIVTSQ